MVGGVGVTRQCIRTGLSDELHIALVPPLLCEGLRLFEGLSSEAIELNRVRWLRLSGRVMLMPRISYSYSRISTDMPPFFRPTLPEDHRSLIRRLDTHDQDSAVNGRKIRDSTVVVRNSAKDLRS